MPPLDAAAIFNLAEAALWFLIAVILLARFLIRSPGPVRPRSAWWLPPTFVVFGISDLIEARTGAWWDPWWLAALKGGCIAVFVAVWLRHRRAQAARIKRPAECDGEVNDAKG